MNEQVAQIQNLCRVGGSTHELRKLIEALNVPTMWRVYVGQSVGVGEVEVPSVTGHYVTHNYGELQEFTVSTRNVGDTVNYKNRVLHVIVNQYTRGDVHVPDTYYFIAIEK